MAAVNEQRDLANDIADLISNPMYNDAGLDEVRIAPLSSTPFIIFCLNLIHPSQDTLREELAELEQSELNERLMGDHVPVHTPPGAIPAKTGETRLSGYHKPFVTSVYFFVVAPHRTEEEDEEEQLKQLQAELAM
jgi:charged multivesicular body protein 4A/B